MVFRALLGAALLLAVCPASHAGENMSSNVSQQQVLAEVRQDIVALHDFFVGWYNGDLPESAFETEFAARLDPSFTIIMPSGAELDYETLSAAMRDSFGKKPGFRIEIRNVRIVKATETTVIATYEEWQENEREEPGSASARISTVAMTRGEVLKWLHVHETWLPEETLAAGR